LSRSCSSPLPRDGVGVAVAPTRMWQWRGGSGNAGGAVDVVAWSRGGGGLGGRASRRWLRTLEIGLGLGQWGVVAAVNLIP
jgi:hypothetical protein